MAGAASIRSVGDTHVIAVHSPVIARITLVDGETYRITTQTEAQRLPRTWVMRFSGLSKYGELIFDARPTAGTQVLQAHELRSAERVPPFTKIVLNKIVR